MQRRRHTGGLGLRAGLPLPRPAGMLQAMPAPPWNEAARNELIAALRRRAQILQPPPELIDRALARCVAFDRRSGRLDSLPQNGTAQAASEAAVPSAVAGALTQAEDGEAEAFAPPAEASEGPSLMPETLIAGYRIVGLIGSGGMGQVYRAKQLSMNREVAFKILGPRFAGNASFRNRFIREARNAGRLQHPNLISVHDVGEVDGLLFFSMELVDGDSVGDVLKKKGAFELTHALAIGRQVLDALIYAHAHGLIHRDIKPDNLMLTQAGVIKVADLGLSRGQDQGLSGATTESGTMMGTPYYMPPEQGRDARQVDARADLYALGATLYHLICGRVPFSGRTAVEVILHATTQPLTWPEPPPPPPVRRLIGRLMAKRAEARPDDAETARGLLDEVLRQLGGRPASVGGSGRQGARPRRWRGLGIAAVLLIAVAAALAIYQRQQQQAWQTVQEKVAAHEADGEPHLARDLLDTYLNAGGRQDEALAARSELMRDWNETSLQAIAAERAQVEDLLRGRRWQSALAAIDAIAAEPALGSPQVQDYVQNKRAQVADLEASDWRRLQARVKELQAAGDAGAAARELAAFEPATQEIAAAAASLRAQLPKTIVDLREWLRNYLQPAAFERGRGSVDLDDAGGLRLRGSGMAQLRDNFAAPDQMQAALRIELAEPALLVLSLGGRQDPCLLAAGQHLHLLERQPRPPRGLRPGRDGADEGPDPRADLRAQVSRLSRQQWPIEKLSSLRLHLQPDLISLGLADAPALLEQPRQRAQTLRLWWLSPPSASDAEAPVAVEIRVEAVE